MMASRARCGWVSDCAAWYATAPRRGEVSDWADRSGREREARRALGCGTGARTNFRGRQTDRARLAWLWSMDRWRRPRPAADPARSIVRRRHLSTVGRASAEPASRPSTIPCRWPASGSPCASRRGWFQDLGQCPRRSRWRPIGSIDTTLPAERWPLDHRNFWPVSSAFVDSHSNCRFSAVCSSSATCVWDRWESGWFRRKHRKHLSIRMSSWKNSRCSYKPREQSASTGASAFFREKVWNWRHTKSLEMFQSKMFVGLFLLLSDLLWLSSLKMRCWFIASQVGTESWNPNVGRLYAASSATIRFSSPRWTKNQSPWYHRLFYLLLSLV